MPSTLARAFFALDVFPYPFFFFFSFFFLTLFHCLHPGALSRIHFESPYSFSSMP